MQVHVTGAKGFIGTVLTAKLHSAGHIIVDGISEAEVVVHLAAIAHRRATAEQLEEVNVRLTERIGREAATAGARVIFLSSVKVHGENSPVPLRETTKLAPADAYGNSKARAEEALGGIRDLRLTVLRPPLVYGPRVKANFLRIMSAVAGGWPLPLASVKNRRSLIYVCNLVDAILRCLNVSGTFLVSDGEAVSTAQLCRDIGSALGRPARLFPFPPSLLPHKLADSLEVDDSAIRRTLGWQPPFTRQAGLQATADWYRTR